MDRKLVIEEQKEEIATLEKEVATLTAAAKRNAKAPVKPTAKGAKKPAAAAKGAPAKAAAKDPADADSDTPYETSLVPENQVVRQASLISYLEQAPK